MVTCTEGGRVARISGAISAPAVHLVVVLNLTIHVAVWSRLVGRVQLVLVVSPFPPLFAVHLFTARRQLIVLRLSVLHPPFGSGRCFFPFRIVQSGWRCLTSLQYLHRTSLLVSPASCIAMPRPAAGLKWEGRERLAVDKHGMYHVPNAHQFKVPLLVASVSHTLMFCRRSLQNDIIVTRVVHRLSHFLKKVTASVQDE